MKSVIALIGAPCAGKTMLADLASDRGHHIISPHQLAPASLEVRDLNRPLAWEGEMNGMIARAAVSSNTVVIDGYPLTVRQSEFVFNTFDRRKWRFSTVLLAINQHESWNRMMEKPEYQDKKYARRVFNQYDEYAMALLPHLQARSDNFRVLEANRGMNHLSARFLSLLMEEENCVVDNSILHVVASA